MGDLHPGGPRLPGGGWPVLSPVAPGGSPGGGALREGSRGLPARARPGRGRAVTMVTAAGRRRPGLSHAAARSAVHCGPGKDGRLLDVVVRGVGLFGAAGRVSPSPPASPSLPFRSSPILSRLAGVRGSWEPRWAGRGSRRRECRARRARGASGGPGPGPRRHLGPSAGPGDATFLGTRTGLLSAGEGGEGGGDSPGGRRCFLRARPYLHTWERSLPLPLPRPPSPPAHLCASTCRRDSLGPRCVLGWRLLLTCCLALPL